MNTTFVDASFLFARVLSDDVNHERARAWERCVRGRPLTTEYVLFELADGLSAPALRALAVETLELIRSHPGIAVLPASTALMDEGLALYHLHSDKQWGLTDCVSFAVMRRQKMTDALSSDRHFERAGFWALLREEPP